LSQPAIWFQLVKFRVTTFPNNIQQFSAVALFTGVFDTNLSANRITPAGPRPFALQPPGSRVRDEDLMAQRFDADTLALSGEPALVAQGVYTVRSGNRASYSISGTGVLVYTNASRLDTQLSWFDRSGKALERVGAPGRFSARRPQLSRDGRRVAIEHGMFGTDEDIWLHELADGAVSRLTFQGGRCQRPLWSPDGDCYTHSRRTAWSSARSILRGPNR
jgi:hypothetical protein